MTPAVRLRQRFLLAFAAVTAVLILTAFWMLMSQYGWGGAARVPSGTPFVDVVESVEPGSPAAAAGIRAGDTIDIRELSSAERLRFRSGHLTGERVTLPITRGRSRLSLTYTAQSILKSPFWRDDGWDQVLSTVGELWGVVLAAVIVWRRPENARALILAAGLILNNFAVAIQAGQNFWVTPWPVLDVFAYALGQAVAPIGFVAPAVFALQFARPVSPLRRIVTWLTYAVAATIGVSSTVGVVGEWFGQIDSQSWFFAQPVPTLVLTVAFVLLPLASVALAIRDARGAERASLAWAAGAFTLLYIPVGIYFLAPPTGLLHHLANIIVNVAVLLYPIGLTYALLSRRLLDVGFALNRAAVFTTITLVVVGAFSLVEWALGGWLQSASKTTNLIVSAALAMGLGLSIYPIHAWVDRFVDRVFFRKRYEDERALHRFAHEAAFITDPSVTVERAKAELSEHADCAFVDVDLYDGRGRYGAVGENDPALVTLRSSMAPLDLHGVETALRGEIAYPMVARGRLVGVLTVGPKRSAEAYAPDESETIAEVARASGIALDALGVGRADEPQSVLDALAALDRTVQSMQRTIVERLGEVRETS